MRNLWVQKRSARASWRADISAFAALPNTVTDLLMNMIRLGRIHGVAIVNEESVAEKLRNTHEREHRINCGFMDSFTPRARVSWFDNTKPDPRRGSRGHRAASEDT